MRVTVRLFATLARFRSNTRAGSSFEVELPEGANLQDLVASLQIPPEETHVTFINNIIQELDAPLHDGDRVGLFPPIGGG